VAAHPRRAICFITSAEHTMLYKRTLHTILKFVVLLAISELALGDAEAHQSVGKLRSGAELAFSNGDTEQSIKLWEEVIKLEPDNDSNYYKRFRVFLRQQKLKEALSDLNSAIKLNPKNENALVQRTKLAIRMGRCEEAVHDFEALRKYVISPCL
jgi:tetratricopeptide (TPR) repeat protein